VWWPARGQRAPPHDGQQGVMRSVLNRKRPGEFTVGATEIGKPQGGDALPASSLRLRHRAGPRELCCAEAGCLLLRKKGERR
jgi:hypothetical protein